MSHQIITELQNQLKTTWNRMTSRLYLVAWSDMKFRKVTEKMAWKYNRSRGLTSDRLIISINILLQICHYRYHSSQSTFMFLCFYLSTRRTAKCWITAVDRSWWHSYSVMGNFFTTNYFGEILYDWSSIYFSREVGVTYESQVQLIWQLVT